VVKVAERFRPRPQPRYRCRAVDILLTNFHLPRSMRFMLAMCVCCSEAKRRRVAKARFALPTVINLVALILRSARLARFVAFPTFGGLSGAFVHAVTFALVVIVPRTSDRADQDQPEDISPISLRHRQPPNISVSSELNERFAVKPAGGTRPSSISGISFPVKQRGAHHLTPSRAAAAIPRSGSR
jgi:hypothetical protein